MLPSFDPPISPEYPIRPTWQPENVEKQDDTHQNQWKRRSGAAERCCRAHHRRPPMERQEQHSAGAAISLLNQILLVSLLRLGQSASVAYSGCRVPDYADCSSACFLYISSDALWHVDWSVLPPLSSSTSVQPWLTVPQFQVC